jgi:hypothetical protein
MYARSHRLALADYFIGKKLNGSRPNRLQFSPTILNRLASDELPGFTTTKIKGLGTLRQKWVAATGTQAEAKSAALDAHAELQTLPKGVTDRRLAIPLAADAEWSHSDEEHGGVQQEFALRKKRPLPVSPKLSATGPPLRSPRAPHDGAPFSRANLGKCSRFDARAIVSFVVFCSLGTRHGTPGPGAFLAGLAPGKVTWFNLSCPTASKY